MSQMNKRFDNWNNVDCNECTNYWTNACDGVSEGQRKPCNSFLAQRSVTIPAEIKSLRSELIALQRDIILILITFAVHFLGHIFNWW